MTLPTWTEYVQFTHETARYPGVDMRGEVPEYVCHGLQEEYGEIHGVFKRRLRDDGEQWTLERLAQLRGEIGDCLWYCARYAVHLDEANDYDAKFFTERSYAFGFAGGAWWNYFGKAMHDQDIDAALSYLQELASEFNWTLAEIAAANMAKLRDRKARGVIQGSGDHR